MTTGTRRRDERGQMVAVEAALLIPAFVLFVALVIGLGRHALAVQAVSGAAAQAARSASIERTVADARAAATRSLDAALDEAGVDCLEQSLTVDAAGITAPIGAHATVSVSVTCRVDFGVTIPGFPSSIRVHEVRSSAVDTYRGEG